MKAECKRMRLNPNGKREAVKRRLKGTSCCRLYCLATHSYFFYINPEYFKENALIEAGQKKPQLSKNPDFFIVIDFEATCEEENPNDYHHEIIEFPAVLVDAKSGEMVDVFHEFVRPVINPTLSDFCKELTAISQATLDQADPFPVVQERCARRGAIDSHFALNDNYFRFVSWLKKHRLGCGKSFSIVTDGPYDMGRFYFQQFYHIGQPFPAYACQWINIRKAFSSFYRGK